MKDMQIAPNLRGNRSLESDQETADQLHLEIRQQLLVRRADQGRLWPPVVFVPEN
jgi:hypothetical protein